MEKQILKEIHKMSEDTKMPNKQMARTISCSPVQKLAHTFGVLGKDIEMFALKEKIIPKRYMRNLKTFSIADQMHLLNTKIAIIGVGGLGGYVAEIMVRSGIGEILLIDGDVFESHNLNRQLYSSQNLLGTPKVYAAKDRMTEANSSILIHAIYNELTPDNAERLLKNVDLVVDCLDNIHTRFFLQTTLNALNKKLVSAAIGGLTGHITTIFPGDKGFENIYGDPSQLEESKGVETMLGTPPHTVSLLASLQCSEAFKVILGWPHHLRNKLFIVDLMENQFETLSLD